MREMGVRAFLVRVRPAWRTPIAVFAPLLISARGHRGQPPRWSASHPPIGGWTIVGPAVAARAAPIGPRGRQRLLVVKVALEAGVALLDVARLEPLVEADRDCRALGVDGGHALPERVVRG